MHARIRPSSTVFDMSLVLVSLVVGGATVIVFGVGFWVVRFFLRRFENGRD